MATTSTAASSPGPPTGEGFSDDATKPASMIEHCEKSEVSCIRSQKPRETPSAMWAEAKQPSGELA
jgi:hypothetical protein